MRNLLLCFFILPFFVCSQEDSSGVVEGICINKRGKILDHVRISCNGLFTESNAIGYFEIRIPSNKTSVIKLQLDSIFVSKKVFVSPNQRLTIGKVKLPIQDEATVYVRRDRESDLIQKLPALDLQKLPTTNVERTLIYTTAASSNNELTSNYNVRGGSYDENLVYVNGFQINRPFLTRSGQQEGLSFLYSSLVKDIRFSGGGFDAKYGDKLSSVLDITYLTPDSLSASLTSSFMGVESHVAHKVNTKFNYLAGVRYRNNGYLLNSLPVKGSYNPIFYDAQLLTNYSLKNNLIWSVIGHISSNNYKFAPQTQQTDFGTVNEAYRLKIYFDGQEVTTFQTMTGGTSLKWSVNPRTQLDFYTTIFHTNEREHFDVQGQYFINLLESNPAKENFGDSVKSIGIGSYLNHARNDLTATIFSAYHQGSYQLTDKQKLFWGISYQKDIFTDKLSEWKNIDSAGYTLSIQIPTPTNLELSAVIKGNLNLQTQRLNGYVQHSIEWGNSKPNYPVRVKKTILDSLSKKKTEYIFDTIPFSYARFVLTSGMRVGYTEVNNDFYITPRISLAYFPRLYYFHNGKVMKRNAQLKLASGLYYQPPIYREFRTFEGTLNTTVISQKSFHVITSYEYLFSMWNRKLPFKLTTEAYYKYFWNVNPYEIDNVRTRYFANNDAIAYAYGADLSIHGEFIEGIQSFFKIGLLSAKENLLKDSYMSYRNQAGEQIIKGYTADEKVVDSLLVQPGWIPRPTDQILNCAILFQDKMPNYEMLSAQMGLVFGSKLPYGPPDHDRYKDTLRQKSYFRVDLGISYDLLHKAKNIQHKKTKLSDAILSLEIFNLMGINNILSKQWVQDVSGKYFAIPNYLTQRRFNLKLIIRI